MSQPRPADPERARRLRILVLSPYWPYPAVSGVTMRIYQLARQLAARHDVTLLSYAAPEDATQVEALARQMSVRAVYRREPSRPAKRVQQLRSLASIEPFACRALHSREMQAAIDELCAGNAFDAIHVESSTLWSFRLPDGVPVVLDEHNIEYELLGRLCKGERSRVRRAFNRLEHVRFRRFERRCWERAAACVVTSQRELPTVRTAAPATLTEVVPNGVDLDDFAPGAEPAKPRTVVFNATFNYRPNLDAALWLLDEVWPLVLAKHPAAKLALVGNATQHEVQELTRPGVELVGQVPDVRPYLRSAEVVAVPVRMGGGTRLKVVEALSLGKAMVSTTLGCEGLAVGDREHLLVGDDAAAFAAAILELFDDASLRARLGATGRRLVESRYSWALAGERLDALYEQVTPSCA
jgi:glycosyltransferase involved in cell wall biosynthesis